MRFTSLSAAAFFAAVYATPITIPGVNLSAAPEGASIVANSYILIYKDTTSDTDFDQHHTEINTKLGKRPKLKININGFRAAILETDAEGLAKVGKSTLVCC
jgi:hypothetical protein